MRRQWSINGRFATQSITGVQRYAHEVVRGLDQLLSEGHPLAHDLDVELVFPPGTPNLLNLRSIRSRRVGHVGGHLWEQTVLPRHAPNGLVSLCNTGPLVARKQIVCIHDVNTRSYPSSYSLQFRALYRALLPALGRTAAALATVSHYSAHELVRYGVCAKEKIAVMPDGHEHALRWLPRHSAETRAAASPNTIVINGSPVPHKNVRLVLELADRLESAGLRIAVVGVSDPRVFRAGEFGPPADNIFWLGRVSDNELAALLLDSMCLAFPSFVEGFGLPPLEAMALGCPVVVSDRASLPEICAEAALYASATNPEDWFASFMRLQKDAHTRAELVKRGRARALLFSWRRTAELYLHAMARADGIRIREIAGKTPHTVGYVYSPVIS
jgi:glycosyltransferase involved in cell wall biosynthesis